MNYRKAEITPRQRAMLDFAMKLALHSAEVDDADIAALKAHGFRDITICIQRPDHEVRDVSSVIDWTLAHLPALPRFRERP